MVDGGDTPGNVTNSTAMFCTPVVLHAAGLVEVVAIVETRGGAKARLFLWDRVVGFASVEL